MTLINKIKFLFIFHFLMAYYYLIKVSHIFSRWRVIFFVDVLVSTRHKLLLAQNLQFLALHMLKAHNFIFEMVNEKYL